MNESTNGVPSEVCKGVSASGSNQITHLIELVDKARRPGFLKHPHMPDHASLLIRADGTIDAEMVRPRAYRATSIDGLIAMANYLSTTPEGSREGNKAVISVASGSAMMVLEEQTARTHRVELQLPSTKSIGILDAGGFSGVTQDELDWELRSNFPNRVAPASFLPQVRKLKFKASSSGGREIGHGRETVDLSVEAELSGSVDPFPEEIILKTPVFEELASMEMFFEVRCAVRVNTAERTFTIKPLEGEVFRARLSARQYIATLIRRQVPESIVVLADAAI